VGTKADIRKNSEALSQLKEKGIEICQAGQVLFILSLSLPFSFHSLIPIIINCF
jgi:hypothetical protein